jgi:hypothetical protein
MPITWGDTTIFLNSTVITFNDTEAGGGGGSITWASTDVFFSSTSITFNDLSGSGNVYNESVALSAVDAMSSASLGELVGNSSLAAGAQQAVAIVIESNADVALALQSDMARLASPEINESVAIAATGNLLNAITANIFDNALLSLTGQVAGADTASVSDAVSIAATDQLGSNLGGSTDESAGILGSVGQVAVAGDVVASEAISIVNEARQLIDSLININDSATLSLAGQVSQENQADASNSVTIQAIDQVSSGVFTESSADVLIQSVPAVSTVNMINASEIIFVAIRTDVLGGTNSNVDESASISLIARVSAGDDDYYGKLQVFDGSGWTPTNFTNAQVKVWRNGKWELLQAN